MRYVAQASARLVVVMTPAGQVLAQHGFPRAVDLMARRGASARRSWRRRARWPSWWASRRSAPCSTRGGGTASTSRACRTARGPLIVLTVFGKETSIGLVELFFDEFAVALDAAAPADQGRGPVLAENFEAELGQSLASLFGR